jgi:hypothetical protein
MPEKLHGISGCSIWLAVAEGKNPVGWKQDDARIIAVQTGFYHKDTNEGSLWVVKGTRWFVVLQFLKKAHPELAPALAIHGL